MAEMKGSQTEQNLLIAFAGESQARNRYDYFAKKAKAEGYVQVSWIFEETALHEMQHAKRYFSFLPGGAATVHYEFPSGVIGPTLENLKEAMAGEHHENTEMYPGYAKVAKDEGFNEVAALFTSIARAEEYHERRYKAMIDLIEQGLMFKRDAKVSWKCLKCGYHHEGLTPPEKCPACAHPKDWYEVSHEPWS